MFKLSVSEILPKVRGAGKVVLRHLLSHTRVDVLKMTSATSFVWKIKKISAWTRPLRLIRGVFRALEVIWLKLRGNS